MEYFIYSIVNEPTEMPRGPKYWGRWYKFGSNADTGQAMKQNFCSHILAHFTQKQMDPRKKSAGGSQKCYVYTVQGNMSDNGYIGYLKLNQEKLENTEKIKK